MRQAGPAMERGPRLLTVEQWAELDEDVEGELVDGILEEEELATFLHEMVVAWLLGVLRPWALARRGFAVGAEAKLAVGPRRGRKPDVSVFLGSSKPRLEDSLARVAPHLVIEVVSPRPRDARRDRVEKIGDYAALGARYYWLVDPQVRSLEVLRLGPRRRYQHVLDVSGSRIERVPGCEGLVLDLDALWAEIDAVARGRRAKGRSAAR